MKKKIYYISPRDMLKSRVDPIMMMQTCNSLAKEDNKVHLVTPYYFRKENVDVNRIWEHYRLPKNQFELVILPTYLRDNSREWIVKLQKFFAHFLYSLKILICALISPKNQIVIISRCLVGTLPYLLVIAPFRNWRGIIFSYELHAFKNTFEEYWILRRMDHVFCISENLRKKLCHSFHIERSRTSVARMGVNLSYYQHTSEELLDFRNEKGFSKNQFIAMYTGKIFPGQKELEYIIDAATMCPEVLFVLVGGKSEVVNQWKEYCTSKNISNVHFTGFVSPTEVVKYQLIANALLIYYPGDWPIKDFVSPGKMMEYMATGNPIIAVDFPVIKEVLKHNKNALFVPSDQPKLLASAIRQLQTSPELAQRLGEQAKRDVIPFSWDNRARTMMHSINGKSIHHKFNLSKQTSETSV